MGVAAATGTDRNPGKMRMSGGQRLSLFEARDVSNEATSVAAWPAISWGQPSGGQWNIANRPSRITSDAPGCCPFGRLPGSQQRALRSWRLASLFVEGSSWGGFGIARLLSGPATPPHGSARVGPRSAEHGGSGFAIVLLRQDAGPSILSRRNRNPFQYTTINTLVSR